MKTKRKRRPSHKSDALASTSHPPKEERSAAVEPSRLSRGWRALISAGLIIHLLAVVVPPMSVPPASELQFSAMRGVNRYSNLTFTNHGYRFFAPDPGPSHMVRAEITLKDGTRLPDVVHPNLQEQWPRLLYHRHFMLTSRLAQAPGDPMGRALAESYARHLFARHDAREVRLYRRLHLLATPDQVLHGVKLTDESLFETPYDSPLGVWKGRSGSGSRETDVVLEVRLPGNPGEGVPLGEYPLGLARLSGKILGEDIEHGELLWELGPGGGMAFQDQRTRRVFGCQPMGPHERLLRYPLDDGSEHALLLTREPPPLVVYRGEQP